MIEKLMWMFGFRYWYHCRRCKKFGIDPLPRADWEKLIRDCDYTVVKQFMNNYD